MDIKGVLRTAFILFCVMGRGSAIASPTLNDFDRLDYEVSSKQSETSKKSFQRSLSGLYSINSWRSSDIRQPYSHFNALYQVAPHAQEELSNLIKEVGMMTGNDVIIPDVKSKERALSKIETELNGDASQITDLARASIVARDIPSLVQAFELVGKESTLIAVKNRFKNPAPSGYRDLKVLVQLPETGMIAEVQLHLDAISTVKSGPEHDIYEQIQHIERRAQQESRDLSEFELAQISQLRVTSQALYHDAWQQYLHPNRLAS
ncbi:RelA/SpoT domain-containing protein [Photobacterium ganghwense]|uniref:RelA/SpoT domain-containing protein n=1 Tax=Photobacterium ganghwense TaxID=320778 RepID=UPI004056E892